MKRSHLMMAVIVSLLLGAGSAAVAAQEASQTEANELPGWTRAILGYLNSIEEKPVAIAEDFPEDLYNSYRPQDDPDVRTAAEILLHIARVNTGIAFGTGTEEQKQAYVTAHGGPPNVRNFVFTTKADTVAKVKESFEAMRHTILESPGPKNVPVWTYAVTHTSEHFGNLVTYYRVNGLTPPTSRQ